MKNLLILGVIFCLGVSAFAQNFEKRWTEVEKLESLGKSKSALKAINAIFQTADRRKNDKQLVKAFLYKTKYTLLLKEDAQNEVYREFTQLIARKKTPVKQLLASVLAQSLIDFKTQNRYKINHRTAIDSTSTHFKTWSQQDFNREIGRLQELSITDEKQLLALPQKEFENILRSGENYGKFQSTLYDLLAQRYLNQLSSSYYWEDRGYFPMKNPDYFSGPEKFSAIKLSVHDTLATDFRSLQLYQHLTELHKKDRLSTFFVTLQRLDFVHEHWDGVNREADSLYLNSLQNLKNNFITDLQRRWIAYKLAVFYHEKAHIDKHPDYELKALEEIENINAHSPSKNALTHLALNLKKEILHPEFSIQAEPQAAPGKPSKALINFKNTDSLYLSFYRFEYEALSSGGYLSDSLIEKYANKKTPFQIQKISLPDVDNHLNYSTEVLLPALDLGHYLVIASRKQPTENSSQTLVGSYYQVSTIGLTVHSSRGRTRFVVRNQFSGRPIEHAVIKVQDHTVKLTTNKYGIADLTEQDRSQKYFYEEATVRYRNQEFTFNFRHSTGHNHQEDVQKDIYVNTELLSDRSIYRPAQDFYFKAIVSAFTKDGSFRQSVSGLPVKMMLYNANHLAIDSINLKTNAFGSVNGTFKLPSNGLTGQFRLAMHSNPSKIERKAFMKENPWAKRVNSDFEQPSLTFRVEEYKRPKFEVNFDKIDSTYVLGDSVMFTGTAKAFFGAKIAHRPVRFTVNRRLPYYYRYDVKMNNEPVRILSDTVMTDEEGNFKLAFKALTDSTLNEKNRPVFNFETEASLTDINGETHSAEQTIKIGYHTTQLLFDMPATVTMGQNQSLRLKARDLNNLKSYATGTLKLFYTENRQRIIKQRALEIPDFQQIPKKEFLKFFPHQTYNKEESGPPAKKLVKTIAINTQERDSIAFDNLAGLPSGDYIFEFKGTGKRGYRVEETQPFDLNNPEKPQQKVSDFLVWSFALPQNKKRVNFTFKTNDSIYVYWEMASGDELQQEEGFWLPAGITEKQVTVPPKTEVFNARISYFKDGYSEQRQQYVQIPITEEPKRDLHLEVIHFEDKMKPGAPQTCELSVHNEQGKPLEAEVSASMYDASLDQFSPHQWELHLFNPTPDYVYQNGLPALNFETGTIPYPRYTVLNDTFSPGNYTTGLSYSQLNLFGYDFVDVQSAQQHYLTMLISKFANEKGFTGMLSGTVTDENGNPLPGVNISVLGSYKAVQTDFDGRYALQIDKNDVVEFRYIGFENARYNITDFNRLNVSLTTNGAALEEVVVTGNGPSEQKMKTLEGKAAGIQVKQDKQVALRGLNALGGQEDPLFVIDGKVMSPDEFKKLNKGDISSVKVLKDAAATSLYGSRGRNGVVVVTTKNAEKELDQIEPRSDLKETAFFLPVLKTDKEGNVRFQFNGPEALTRWKFQAFAHDKALYQDYLSRQSITQKELNIIPNFPRFFRSGDEVVISAKINNMTEKEVEGTAQLKFTNAYSEKEINLVHPSTQPQFSIRARGNTEVSWTIKIPENLGAVRYTISAKANNFTDAQADVLPVLSHRLFITESFPFWVHPEEKTGFEFLALKNTSSKTLSNHGLVLEYTANPVWTALESLPYLIEFPYECAEQTFARFYGNQLAFTVVKNNPKISAVLKKWETAKTTETPLEKNANLKSVALEETPWMQAAQSREQQQKELAKLLNPEHAEKKADETLRWLSEIQLDSGGFPWFSGGDTNEQISLHIFAGFARLKKLSALPVDNPVYTQIIDRLDRYLSGHYKRTAFKNDVLQPERFNTSLLMFFYAKNELNPVHGDSDLVKLQEAVLETYNTTWVGLSLREKLMLALVNQQNENAAMTDKILTALKEQAVINAEQGMYWKENTPGRLWVQSPIAAQTLAIEVFAGEGNEQKTVDLLKEWLLHQKQLQAWESTKATTNAIYALLVNGNDWTYTAQKPDVTVGNSSVSFENSEAQTGYVRKKFEKDDVSAEKASIHVNNQSKSPQYGALYWQYFEDADKVSASASKDLSIEKEWFIKTESPNGSQLKPLSNHGPEIGDVLTVRIVVQAKAYFEFMHLKDLRPAGLEPVDVLSEYRFQDGLGYYQATKDVATHFFFDSLPQGTYVFEYDLLVNNAGTFTGGLTTLQSMYAPEFSVRSEGKKLRVKK